MVPRGRSFKRELAFHYRPLLMRRRGAVPLRRDTIDPISIPGVTDGIFHVTFKQKH